FSYFHARRRTFNDAISSRQPFTSGVLECTLASMNAVIQHRDEVDVPNAEATEAKIDGLRDSLDETKQDIRELRGQIHSLSERVDRHHAEMHAGFAALRKTMDDMDASIRAEIRRRANLPP